MSTSQALPAMSFEEQVGQLVMAVWPPQDADALDELVGLGRIGGLWLAPEVPCDSAALSQELDRLQRLAPYPLLIAADPVAGPAFLAQPEIALGAARQPELARRSGWWAARRARELGINLLLSPNLSVQREATNGLGAWRSFGSNPARVARLGSAWMQGCLEGCAWPVAWPFPGAGSAAWDEERRVAVLPQTRDHLEKVDLAPYAACMESGLPALATGHLRVAALDSLPTRLTTHSSAVVEGLLRHTLGFAGLLLTDRLDHPSLAGRYGAGQAAVLAFAAGHDLIVTANPAETYRALYAVLLHGDVPAARLEQALARAWVARRALHLPELHLGRPAAPPPAEDPVGDIARASLVRISGRREALALHRPLVMAVDPADGRFAAAVQRLAADRLTACTFLPLGAAAVPGEIDKVLAAARQASAALLFAWEPPSGTVQPASGELGQLLAALRQAGLPTGACLAGNPCELLPLAAADLLLYAPAAGEDALDTACAYMLGMGEAPGRLPIGLPGVATHAAEESHGSGWARP
ncbi:MAG: glycoside hydrolase family 3 N-terminal domain-containing protein [Anaerolineae bacterium]